MTQNNDDPTLARRKRHRYPHPDARRPTFAELQEWIDEGGCEAACDHGCWVEPDGYCEHGYPSWLLVYGLT